MVMLLSWFVDIAHKMCRLKKITGGQLSNAKCAVGLLTWQSESMGH